MPAIRPNLHNFVVITLFALLGFLLLKIANTKLKNVPVVGSFTSLATAA